MTRQYSFIAILPFSALEMDDDLMSFFLGFLQLGLNCAVTAGSRVSQSRGADDRASVGSEVWLCRSELNAGIGTGKISVLGYSRGRCYHKKVCKLSFFSRLLHNFIKLNNTGRLYSTLLSNFVVINGITIVEARWPHG